jgi:hypothetical protein
MADAADSKSVGRKAVWVRLPPPAPLAYPMPNVLLAFQIRLRWRQLGMSHPLITEYSQSLAVLSGEDFQDEVTARLQGVITDFQSVPSNPQGDAGIDGLSHHAERAYCCYGPEQDAFKKSKDRERAVVEKFKEDLRRIVELKFVEKQLKERPNVEMKTILPAGRKIKHIELIVN